MPATKGAAEGVAKAGAVPGAKARFLEFAKIVTERVFFRFIMITELLIILSTTLSIQGLALAFIEITKCAYLNIGHRNYI